MYNKNAITNLKPNAMNYLTLQPFLDLYAIKDFPLRDSYNGRPFNSAPVLLYHVKLSFWAAIAEPFE